MTKDLTIEYFSLTELVEWPRNPKQHIDLEPSFDRFGFVKPLLIDEKSGWLVAGHGRLRQLVSMKDDGKRPPENVKVRSDDGEWLVPVIRGVEFKNKREAEAYLIADNETTTAAGWDEAVLLDMIKDQIKTARGNVDKAVAGTGLAPERVSQMLAEQRERLSGGAGNNGSAEAQKEDQDPLDVMVKKWKVKKGDIYIIHSKVKKGAQHRIMCGDTTDLKDVEKLMGGIEAALAFTSPPYWTGMNYEIQESIDEIDEFILKSSLAMIAATRQDRSRIVINTGTGFTTSFDKKKKRHTLLLIDKWTNALFDHGWNLRHVRHWIKDGQMMSISSKNDMIDRHNEFIGTFEADQGQEMKFDDRVIDEGINLLSTHYHPEGATRGQSRVDAAWAMRGMWNDIPGAANQFGHMASFPVELARRVILMYTIFDEVVVDLFLGAGTTIEAAEQLGRISYGMELEPKFVGLSLQRLADLGLSIEKQKAGQKKK